MPRKLYQALASKLQAIANCRATGNKEWLEKHKDELTRLCREHLPSGSGFDNGTHWDQIRCRPERLHLCTSFHHMDDNGSYDGWTDHGVIVTASLANGFILQITGKNRNDIKSYIGDVFHNALNDMVPD